jgi:preprotein translocase subunit SecA
MPKLLNTILRAGEGKKVKRLKSIVPFINALEDGIKSLSDSELKAKTVEFKKRLKDGETLEDLLVEAFAVVREAAKRTIGQRHYDVQLMGGIALHFGWIAEMKTGEGKTLVSTLPVYLNALNQRGVHVVTVNDYLAKRDSEWMGKIHEFLGLSVGLITADMQDTQARKRAYNADITYGTNSEFGFDYLRDNMVLDKADKVQRGHVYAIVDEVDSILIDEARTPLIISGTAGQAAETYYQFAHIAKLLKRDVDYEVEEDKNLVIPTESGIAKVEKALAIDNLYDGFSTNLVQHLIKAIEAKELKILDRDYVVADGEVKIIDEFTHRILEGRRWEEGLHQAVEAKEGLDIKEESQTVATITLQNYFRLYEKLAGMTGTAETEAAEFGNTYGMAVVPIPTNLPMIRVDHPDIVYKTESAKFKAVVEDLKDRYEKGQPVLVGTASVAKSELLSSLLNKEGISHHVLNAKNHFKEAEIVAQAGKKHAVVVSTNMAGRGVDILLGGNPEGLAQSDLKSSGLDPDSPEGKKKYEELLKKYQVICKKEAEEIKALGGLYVLGSERHESRRIDNQLRGRAGRQGDPGESRFYLSFEDDLVRVFASGTANFMVKALPDDMPIERKMFTKAIERAQNTIEAQNSETRKEVLKYDEVMNEQRKIIYKRRDQILDGEDLREFTENLIVQKVESLVNRFCETEYKEDWKISELIVALRQYFPTEYSDSEFEDYSKEEIIEALVEEGVKYYAKRESEIPGGVEAARGLERIIMLQMIDVNWRDHLSDMDYLRTGIGLRAMGQQDPLVAWQKEGFEMFQKLIDTIEDNYLQYILHVDIAPQKISAPEISNVVYHGGESSVSVDEVTKGAQGVVKSKKKQENKRPPRLQASNPNQIVKSDADRLGRNNPCWCGSGKKLKYCHPNR